MSPFEDPFGSAKEDREAKEERELSNASLLGEPFLTAALSAVREKEIANASSASEKVESKSSDGGFLYKGLGSFLDFLFFSFSFLSVLDLELFGILSKLISPLVSVATVLRLSSGGNLVSLGVLSKLNVQVVRSGW